MPSDETEIYGHYRVQRREDGSLWELGSGGMGVTYKAFDENLHIFVALKVIRKDRVANEIDRERFVREARAAASLRHPNIAVVYHLGQRAQDYFYAMEFVDGETVETFVRRAGARPWREALSIVAQVADALEAVHKMQLVHRDIKPANLMLVSGSGETAAVKLIDFGLAKSLLEKGISLSNGRPVCTPQYASPEQLSEEEVDIRTDLYSLGATLWFLLTGEPLFHGPLMMVIVYQLSAPPPWEKLPDGVPDSVRAVLTRTLAKDRSDRPQSPADLRRELEGCLREPSSAPVRNQVALTTVGESAAVRPLHGPSAAAADGENRPSQPDRHGSAAGMAAKPASAAPQAAPDARQLQVKVWIKAARAEADAIWDAEDEFIALPKVAAAQARAGDLAGARQTFAAARQTVAASESPWKISRLVEIAAAQTRAGDVAGARQTFAAARQAADATEDDYYKADHLSQIAAALAKAGDVPGARQTAEAIANDLWKAPALREIAAAQARADDVAGAHQTFTAARRMADMMDYDDSRKASALVEIAAAQAKAGDVAGAHQTFAAARRRADSIEAPYRFSTLSEIAAAQARAGDVPGARRTADAIKDDLYKPLALYEIAVAQLRAGDVAGARQTTDSSKIDSRKAPALVEIAAAQARAGDVAGARQTVAAIKDDLYSADFWKAPALREIAAAQARARDLAGARQTFAAARRAADTIEDEFWKAERLREIAAAQARAGDVPTARWTFAAARQTANAIKDPSHKAVALSDIVAAQVEMNDFAAAGATLASLDPGRHRCLGYVAAANALLDNPVKPGDD